eukprot:scaffold628_cov71-Phaeocystis_antarctica.AAC.7
MKSVATAFKSVARRGVGGGVPGLWQGLRYPRTPQNDPALANWSQNFTPWALKRTTWTPGESDSTLPDPRGHGEYPACTSWPWEARLATGMGVAEPFASNFV